MNKAQFKEHSLEWKNEYINELKTILKSEALLNTSLNKENLEYKLKIKKLEDLEEYLKEQNRIVIKTLEKIADIDFRGNRSPESIEAYNTLKIIGIRK